MAAAAPQPAEPELQAEPAAVASAPEPEPAAAVDEQTPAPADAAAPEGAGRRGRNRRRGRRGGDRAPRPDGDAAAAPPVGDDDESGEGEPGEAAAEPAVPRVPPADVGEVFAQVLSGAYDAEAPADEAAAAAPKRVLAAEPDAPKLHKVLAQAGIGSRRDMEQMIVEGRITVNGQPAHIGQRISFGDRISVGGKPVRVRIAPPPPRVLAYHKPAGEVVTHDDPQQRPTVFRKLPRLQQGKWQSVGRLDINTEGLLLFTNSGELANQLMHPRFGVEREYAVRSLGTLDDECKARLLEGVEIDGQRCAFKSIENGGGEGANHWYRCVITEGRNREVRKLFEAVGHAVSRLIRIRYGSVVLPRGLRRGVWVDLDDSDVRALRRIAGGGQQPGATAAEREGRDGRGKRRGKRGRGPRPDGGGAAVANEASIPNPLQQTFDKRAIQQERRQQREFSEDGPIPNPLQQTYDKRFTQKTHGSGGGNRGGKKGGGGERQPDPMQTSIGYIGADAFLRKARGGGQGGGGGRRGRGR